MPSMLCELAANASSKRGGGGRRNCRVPPTQSRKDFTAGTGRCARGVYPHLLYVCSVSSVFYEVQLPTLRFNIHWQLTTDHWQTGTKCR